MRNYLEVLADILLSGEVREDRTGTGTISKFGMQMRFDLSKGFPAITTKKLAWKAVVSELLWFLEGSTDERRLAEILYGEKFEGRKTIWSANAEASDALTPTLGPIYGKQWRAWEGKHGIEYDQIMGLIDSIKNDPYSRRHILSAWNVGELAEMTLVPCHVLAQFYVSKDGRLSCHLYQRSADMFLGVPFNIASYSLLTSMIAQVCGLNVGEFIWSGGDCHIYSNHVDQVREQVQRTPRSLPKLYLDSSVMSIDGFTMEDIKLESYYPDQPIKAEMSV